MYIENIEYGKQYVFVMLLYEFNGLRSYEAMVVP